MVPLSTSELMGDIRVSEAHYTKRVGLCAQNSFQKSTQFLE